MVVIAGGWCVEKKKGTHTGDTTFHGENKKEKRKKKKEEEVPSVELANFDWIV